MGHKLPCILFLTALLTGCTAGGTSSQLDQSSPPSAHPAAVSGPAPDQSSGFILTNDPNSPYPMTVESWQVDMDGDGVDELVELRAEKAYTSDGAETTDYGMHPYTLVVTQGETVYELLMGHSGENDTPLQPWYFSDPEWTGTCWTEDRSGRPVLALWFDTIAAGGAGHVDVYAAAFQDGAPALLPVPEYSLEAVLDEKTMAVRLIVPETGYTDTLDLDQWLQAWSEQDPDLTGDPLYREDGTLEWPVAPRGIDGHYHAEQAEDGITVRQYMWGSAHMDGMGDLVTTLSWENGQPVVLDQHFEWYY